VFIIEKEPWGVNCSVIYNCRVPSSNYFHPAVFSENFYSFKCFWKNARGVQIVLSFGVYTATQRRWPYLMALRWIYSIGFNIFTHDLHQLRPGLNLSSQYYSPSIFNGEFSLVSPQQNSENNLLLLVMQKE